MSSPNYYYNNWKRLDSFFLMTFYFLDCIGSASQSKLTYFPSVWQFLQYDWNLNYCLSWNNLRCYYGYYWKISPYYYHFDFISIWLNSYYSNYWNLNYFELFYSLYYHLYLYLYLYLYCHDLSSSLSLF